MKFWVIKNITIKIFLALLFTMVLLAINYDGATSASVYFGAAPRKVPIYAVDTNNKQVALSFDTAWGASKTTKIIETLKQFKVNATFFMVGFWVDKYPDMVKAVNDAGIEIGTHSNTHPDFTKLSVDDMKLELTTSINKIKSITNKPINLFRAPYGSYNNSVLSVAENLNLKTIQWDVDSLDWKGLQAMEISNRICNNVKNGSIILCHNNSDNILNALPVFLDRLQKKGYKITSVGDLLYKDNYKIDNLGIQHKK